MLLEDVDEGLIAVGGLLIEGLLEEDDAGEVGEGIRGGEEQLPEGPPVRLYVLHIDAGQPLSDGASALVGRQDALPWRCYVLGRLHQLLCVYIYVYMYQHINVYVKSKQPYDACSCTTMQPLYKRKKRGKTMIIQPIIILLVPDTNKGQKLCKEKQYPTMKTLSFVFRPIRW